MAMTETMTPPTASAVLARPRRNWGAALKALRRLLSDKEDTGQVFEIMRALNGDSNARNYARLLQIKHKYDPGNLFRVHHGVGSETTSD